KPVQRADHDDEVYRTAREKYDAIATLIAECRERGQPVLVGTVSIEKSETLSGLLKAKGVPHSVLNARYHEQEATIVAQAGHPGAVTIATNMAGRGTDIQLGGNADMRIARELGAIEDEAERARQEEAIRAETALFKQRAIDAGGLYVMGTERHEARRIDNQLRGRSGRQGDPGRSKFFLSLQDDLMRIFGSDRMDGMLTKLGLEEDEAITHPWINKAIEKAQSKVEARNFDVRKNILKYDNVMNDQRKVVFEQRREFMAEESVRETIDDMRQGVVDDVVTTHIPPDAYPEQWDIEGLKEAVVKQLNLDVPVDEWAREEGIADEEMRERLRSAADDHYAARVEKNTPQVMTYVEKQVLLQSLDHLWREHLVTLDHLRQVIGWRGLAQRDPLNEYKSEAFQLFETLIGRLREQVTSQLMRIEVVFQQPKEPELPTMHAQHLDPVTGENEFTREQAAPGAGGLGLAAAGTATVPADDRDPNDPATWGRVGRNEACPCGSGKKFKHCHGVLA
ncbi:MAG TPA: SEC-C metal-binding domain-containing protein, partial [Saliniramus sp.]|nr:SEC-C metal-binding domain-containing protein [Saliniramus sp.]